MTKPKYGSTPLAEQRPGAFKAICKMAAWVDVAEVLAQETQPEGAYPGRWNPKLYRSEVLIPCDVEFTGAAAFEAHMRDRHGRTTKGQIDLDSCAYRPIKCRPAKPTPGGEGKPFKASAKAIAETVKQCPTCDLYGEVVDLAGVRWWDEHLAGCALAMAGAAS